MTVFVASLFLPYTIHFDPNHEHISPESLRRPENTEVPVTTSYFDLPRKTALPTDLTSGIPLTPGATTDIEKVFIPESPGTPLRILPQNAQINTKLRSLIRPDLPASNWGSAANGIQPKSRAQPPPPASVLTPVVPVARSPPSSLGLQRGRGHHRASSSGQQFSTSNFTVDLSILGNGGLVSALDAASDHGILEDKTWVGTVGMPTDAISEYVKSDISERLRNDYESLAIWTSDSDLNGHYEHYCKMMLWPVLHYQVPDHPKSKAYEDHSWEFYVRVNEAFAEGIVKNWKRGDTIWIHDYHLLLVPALIRKQLPDAQIGFFLHTAFPSSEIFRCLAMRSKLLAGILGANMVGFQTEEYVHHFLQTCGRLLNVEATIEGVILEDGRLVHVVRCPIGIDPSTIDARRRHVDVQNWSQIIAEKYAGKRLIVARDKLDNVRGVRQKMLAYEMFLNTWPEYKNKVVLIQIATSTTEDPDLISNISDIVSRINSNHSTLAHQPLVFLRQDINYSQWLALLTIANALLVTSLREGMNLTGHEFIYCQDGVLSRTKHSPLIMSEFTGAASLLKDSALLINPWHYKNCAEAIKKALDMSPSEMSVRWKKMSEAVAQHDAVNWYETYRKALDQAYEDHSMRDATSVPRLSYPVLRKVYDSASSRLIVLDYEGTLAAWGSPTDIILTTPKKSIDVLSDLVDDRRNTVYVMSSRRPDEMERLFKQVPGIGMIAENGAFLLEARHSEWIPLVDMDHIAQWKVGVRAILDYFELRIERSTIEELESAFILSFAGSSDKQTAFKQAGECANHINDACFDQKVQALPIDNGICVSDVGVNKSTATRAISDRLLKMATKGVALPDFLMVIGDSREDEYVFDWAHKMRPEGIRDVVTITVGQRNTSASCSLTQGVTGVLSTLQKLTSSSVIRQHSHNALNSKRSD